MQRVAKGWETELRVAYDDILPGERLCPLLETFYKEGAGTRLRLSAEILEGCWDALLSGRADLVIGAPSEAPPEPGVAVRPFGEMDFVFAIAPHHPLAQAPEPISTSEILQHRIIVAADTSRNLPPRSVGLSMGQDTLTVPSMQAKLEAQVAGLGVGFLPVNLTNPAIAAGRLLLKQVEEESTKVTRMVLAWRPRDAGKGLKWWLERLEDPETRRALLA